MMANEYIKILLVEWSEWRVKRMEGGIGHRNKASFLTIPGSSCSWMSEIDSHCHDVDHAVCHLESECKDVIMTYYTQTGTKEQKAQRCGYSIRTYDARLLKAIGCISVTLDDLRRSKQYRRLQSN